MTKFILIDELYLLVFIPRGLPERECRAIRRTLDDARFVASLRRAIRGFIRGHVALNKVRITIPR